LEVRARAYRRVTRIPTSAMTRTAMTAAQAIDRARPSVGDERDCAGADALLVGASIAIVPVGPVRGGVALLGGASEVRAGVIFMGPAIFIACPSPVGVSATVDDGTRGAEGAGGSESAATVARRPTCSTPLVSSHTGSTAVPNAGAERC